MGEGFGGDTRLNEGSADPQLPACLRGDSAEEIFDKLADGDPLGLERRTLRYLDQEGLVLPPFRLIQLSGAQVAFEALRYPGDPPLDAWVRRCIAKAAWMLVEEQGADERQGLPVAQSEDVVYYQTFAQRVGTELELARAVCCTINHLPTEPRRIFHAVAIQGRSPRELADDGHGKGSVDRVNHLLQAATKEILLIFQAGLDRDGGPQL